jgi:TRAP-type transport system small permease protein
VGVVMGIMNINVLYRLLTGKLRDDELVQVIETEGLADVEKQLKEIKA